MVWTTAQGRFGRALYTSGIQHPVPTLTCTGGPRTKTNCGSTRPMRSQSVDSNNVTADPPRTQLWCLLYAQARQADNLETGATFSSTTSSSIGGWRSKTAPDRNRFLKYDDAQRQTLEESSRSEISKTTSATRNAAGIYKLAGNAKSRTEDAAKPRHGRMERTARVSQLLALLRFAVTTHRSACSWSSSCQLLQTFPKQSATSMSKA